MASIHQLTSAEDLKLYDAWVKTHPQGTLWQSLEWKHYQESLGRETRVYAVFDGKNMVASALVVIDSTAFGLSTWDIAKGPIGNEQTVDLMKHLIAEAKKSRCLSIYASPDSFSKFEDSNVFTRDSGRCEQAPASRILDLTKTEEEILAQMHQKGRYNIKVATRHGVEVKPGTSDDIDAFYSLLQSTSKRDGFTISPKSHYTHFLQDLDHTFFLLAYHNNSIVAGFVGVHWNGTGYYYYGASDHAQRALMAPYLVQWEAMKYCKAAGCSSYDLLGIAPPDATDDHHWAGISSFKEKFGGSVVTYPPEQQIILKPVVNALLNMKRKIIG